MFTAESADLEGSFVVALAVDPAFELFSPLGERFWAPDWHPELLFPRDAAWTPGQVFRTCSGANEVVWLVAALDLEAHEVEYHRVETGRHVARVHVRCLARADGGTDVTVRYRFVGLSEPGNHEIAQMNPQTHAARMLSWQSSIERHLQNGRHPDD